MTEKAGHNSVAGDRLRSIVERIERLEDERKETAEAIKDIYAEAKSAGFDTKVLRRVIRERKRDAAEIEEEEATRDMYVRALS